MNNEQHGEPIIYKMKHSGTNMVHRKFKLPDIEGNIRPTRSRGSPTSSRNNTSQEKDMSLDGANSFQSFKIRTFKPVERSETPIEEKPRSMTKSTQVKKQESTEHNYDDLQLPKIYSPITTPRTVITSKMKDSIFKPLLSRAQTIENIITVKFQNKMFEQLRKGANLKCLYSTQRMIESINKIIIIHFDNVFLNQRKTFWESSTEITLCSSVLGKTCNSQYCSCALPKDSKSTFLMISRTYFIILLFECGQRGQIWQKYLHENNYPIDQVYSIPQCKQSKGGLKLKKVVQSFTQNHIELLIYFGVAYSEASYIKIPNEQLYHQIPIAPSQINVQIYLFHFNKSKTIDSKLLQNICMTAQNNGDTFNHSKPLTFVYLDLQPIIQEMIKLEEQDEIKNIILKPLQKETNNEQIDETIDVEEDDKNMLMVWLYQSKKLIQDYFKSLNLEEHHINPYTLIGDILRRNCYLELNFQNQSYDAQARKYRLYCQLKTQTVPQSVLRKQVPIECFIVYD